MKQLLILIFSVFSVTVVLAQKTNVDADLTKTVQLLTGYWTNKKQADTTQNPILKHQEFISMRIWQKDYVGEHWIYMGWFAGIDRSKALAERILLVQKVRDSIKVSLYFMPDEYRSLLPWTQAVPLEKLAKQDLRWNCDLYGIWLDNGGIRLVSPEPVESENKTNYAYLIFDFDFSKKGMAMHNTYFDIHKKPLFSYPQPLGNVFNLIGKKPNKVK